MRRFFITMYQKGNFEKGSTRYKKYITYEKTTNKAIQIVCIDYKGIEKEFEKEKEEYQGVGFLSNPIDGIEHILGIEKNDLYQFRMSLREIKENDIEGYTSFNIKYVTKETEKAYYIKELDKWIPKSQTKKEGNTLYIKRWLLEY